MAYTLDTKVGEILKDSHAVEILERHAPGVSNNSDDRAGKRNDPKILACNAASQTGRGN